MEDLKIEKNIELKNFLTLKIPAKAKYFVRVCDKEELKNALMFALDKKIDVFVLGGGSNTFFKKNYNGLIIKNEIKGWFLKKELKNKIEVEAMSGESWPKFVNNISSLNYYGLENLASIYGTVGAAPVQNIGAYGVELKDVFKSLIAINIKTGKERIFNREECQFAYRSSVFKTKYKNKYFIYSITIELKKEGKLKTKYGSIQDLLPKEKKNVQPIDMIKVINEIRSKKLPNPSLLPNVGSFFKNPEISKKQFLSLQMKNPEIPYFESDNNKIKIPAAWLIEKAGFKGKVFSSVSMYEKQALILVNHGNAKSKDVINLAKKIKNKIKNMFAIDLEEEVNII